MGKRSPVKRDRLWLPVSKDPFKGFKDGSKTIEVRNCCGQYTPSRCRTGRRVLVRRGYSTSDEYWGVITGHAVYTDLNALFRGQSWRDIFPWCSNRASAYRAARKYTDASKGSGLIAIHIQLDIHRTKCQLAIARPEPKADAGALDRFNVAVNDAKRRAGYAPRGSRPSISITMGAAKGLVGGDA